LLSEHDHDEEDESFIGSIPINGSFIGAIPIPPQAESEEEAEETEITAEIRQHKTMNGKIHVLAKLTGDKRPAWVPLFLIWSDFPADVKAYVKKKKLKGTPWKTPTKAAIEFVERVFDHRDDESGRTEFELLWDNGYRWWSSGVNATLDAPDLIKKYKLKHKLK
jgi:hypothetical protein